MESTECGAASLGIILAFHGRHVPLTELRVECGVSRDGSNALFIKKAGEKYGLSGKGYQMTVDELGGLELPFLVFWNMNHFLVVEGFGRDRVYLNDPATGRRTVSETAFRASYTGIAFRFVPGPNFRKGGARPSAWKGVARRIKGAGAGVAFVVLAGAALTVADLVGATFPLIFVDQLLIEGRRQWLRPLLLAMAATALLRYLLVKVQRHALLRLEIGLATTHSARFLWHVLRLPVAFFQQRSAGDLSRRVEGNSTVADLVSGELATTIVGLVMVVFYAAMMSAFDPLLACLGAAIGGLNIVGIAAAGRFLADESLKIRQDRSKLYGSLTRTLQMIETIKAGASEPEALVHLTGHQARLSNASQAVGAAGSLLVALPPFLSVLTTAAVLGIGGSRVIEGVMSIGALVSLQTLMANFHRPFSDLVRLGTTLQSLQAELARLDDVHLHELEPTFAPSAAIGRPDSPPRLSGHLELRGVTFGFNRTLAEPLIHRFSLELRPGSRVALVGDSGSGKSTIGRLVAGLYRPWDGEILYDGRPIEQIPRQLFTDQVALVDDQTFLFSGTIRENVTLWDETIVERDLHRAAMDAEIHRDLIKRRGGYQARLAEGARNLSGGQRQRLEITRALVRDPAILVLDEATSALDPVTEALVDDHLRRRGCTCLIIAHRLSTIRDCDEIVVLRQGRVIQRGTHDELMCDLDGFYRELQVLQAGSDAAKTEAPAEPSSGEHGPVIAAPSPSGVAGPTACAAIAANGHGPDTARGNGRSRLAREPSETDAARAIELMEVLEPESVTVVTAGNCPLMLDDPGAVWRVVEGRVDVFHVESATSATPGRRRHLCRVEEGGAIFAMDGVPSEAHGELLAIGVGPARLRRFARTDLMRLSFDPEWRREVAEMIDDWVDRISRATAPHEPPVVNHRLGADDAREVAAGERAAPRNQLLWIRQDGLPTRFFGEVEVPRCPYTSRFPLSHHGWLSFDGAGPIHAVDTETLMEDGDPWVGLRRFHAVVLGALSLLRRRDDAAVADRLERSARRDAALLSNSLAGLSRLATRSPIPVQEAVEGERLLAAAHVVAAAQGIEVKPLSLAGAEDPLRQIARASGFRTRRVRLAIDWTASDSGPLLGFLEEGNVPVALLRSPSGSYTLIDPSRVVSTAVTPEVARTLSPTAIMFYRTFAGAGRLSARELVRFGLPAVRPDLRTLLAAGVVGGLLGLVIPWVVGVAIDQAIPRADHHQLGLLCAFLVAVGLACASFQVIQGLALVRIKGRLEATLLPAAWDRLLNLPVQFFMKQAAGDLALRAMALPRVIGMIDSTWIASLMMSVFALLNLVVLFAYNARLALIAAGLMAVMPLATAVILRAFWRSQRLVLKLEGEISGLLLLLIGGVARIRVAGAERRAMAYWAEKYRRQLDVMIRSQRQSDRLLVLSAVWPAVVVMVVFGLALGQTPSAMSAGEFLAFNLALSQALAAVVGVGGGMLTLLYGLEEYARFRPLLKVRPETAGHRPEAIELRGALRVANVSFRYEPNGPLILDSVDLQVRPGEFVAIVGSSGSGKSTLFRLLLGFETPTEGTVAYDGRDLPTLDIQEVRRQCGVVLQDAQLRPGDLYTNIVGNSPQRTRDDAWEAAHLAGVAADIERMPMGIHTVIGEGGGGISSGQRQRLMIARALAGRPKILLFDEATSVLDNRSQATVFENIRTKLEGTTLLAIAHRLSTVVDADRIYVLEGGRVVQCGRYAQLIREPGPFQDLARRQTLA